MEKNRIKPVYSDKTMRMSFQRQKEVLNMPNLIEVQKNSYDWFINEGLKEVFDDIFPITDYSGNLSMDFVSYEFCKNETKYSIDECKARDATYAAPLKMRVRLRNPANPDGDIKDEEIFMGELPIMTDTGTFVINGAERVIVSQLVRSPGIYYGIDHDKTGKRLYSCTVIPNRGAWLEYETDSNDIFYVRVDRTRKVPVTVLIRALGIGSNEEILDYFGDEPKIHASFGKDKYTGKWVEMCGAKYSLPKDDNNANVNLTKEQLMQFNPDFIFFSMPGEAQKFVSDDTWSGMTAVTSGHVYNIPSGINTWSNSGAESALIFSWAQNIMYRNQSEYNVEREVYNYYKKFYSYELNEEEIKSILEPR